MATVAEEMHGIGKVADRPPFLPSLANVTTAAIGYSSASSWSAQLHGPQRPSWVCAKEREEAIEASPGVGEVLELAIPASSGVGQVIDLAIPASSGVGQVIEVAIPASSGSGKEAALSTRIAQRLLEILTEVHQGRVNGQAGRDHLQGLYDEIRERLQSLPAGVSAKEVLLVLQTFLVPKPDESRSAKKYWLFIILKLVQALLGHIQLQKDDRALAADLSIIVVARSATHIQSIFRGRRARREVAAMRRALAATGAQDLQGQHLPIVQNDYQGHPVAHVQTGVYQAVPVHYIPVMFGNQALIIPAPFAQQAVFLPIYPHFQQQGPMPFVQNVNQNLNQNVNQNVKQGFQHAWRDVNHQHHEQTKREALRRFLPLLAQMGLPNTQVPTRWPVPPNQWRNRPRNRTHQVGTPVTKQQAEAMLAANMQIGLKIFVEAFEVPQDLAHLQFRMELNQTWHAELDMHKCLNNLIQTFEARIGCHEAYLLHWMDGVTITAWDRQGRGRWGTVGNAFQYFANLQTTHQRGNEVTFVVRVKQWVPRRNEVVGFPCSHALRGLDCPLVDEENGRPYEVNVHNADVRQNRREPAKFCPERP